MNRPRLRFGLEWWAATGDTAAAGRLAYVGTRASLTAAGRPGLDLLRDAGARLAAVWVPEHGYGATGAPGASVTDEEPPDALPVWSLYGERDTPDEAMLADIDTIVFDLQDVGARYYTYWHVLKRCLEASERAGKRVVVCDRPNPLGASAWGNVLPADRDAPVGCWPMAMQHGVTTGDVADAWHGQHPEVHVERAPMEGWRRVDRWPVAAVPWTPPSPNLPDLAAVEAYPGTCLGEGLNLSVGRGTPWPFQWIGAPWLDAAAVSAAVNDRQDAWRAAAMEAIPARDIYAGERCRGVYLACGVRDADPIPVVLMVLAEIVQRHGSTCRFFESHFDALAGGPALRAGILAGRSVAALMQGWESARATAALQPTDVYN